VYTCAVSDNKKYFISSGDNILQVWDFENVLHSQIQNSINGHTKIVNDCCIPASRKFIVTGSFDKTLKKWDYENCTLQQDINLNLQTGFIECCCVTNDGKLIFSGTSSTLNIIDTTTGSIIKAIKHSSALKCCCISNDNTFIVTGTAIELRIIDITSGEIIKKLVGHSKFVESVCISYDGNTIVSTEDLAIKIWQRNSGILKYSITVDGNNFSSCFIPNSNKFVVANTNWIKIFDSDNGMEINTIATVRFPHEVNATDKLIACTVYGNFLRVWESKTFTIVAEIENAESGFVLTNDTIIVVDTISKTPVKYKLFNV